MTAAILRVYKPDGLSFIATVPRRRGLAWLDEMNAPGTGKFEIHLEDPVFVDHPDLLDEGNICRIYLNGVARKAFVIEDVNPVRVAGGEKADEWVSVAGSGVMRVLEYAIVYPEYGLRALTSEDRYFNFAAADGTWRDLGQWYTPIAVPWTSDTTARHGLPVGWKDPAAAWLWSTSPNSPAMPGPNWFRTEFTLTESTAYALYATADNDFTLYLDGSVVLTNGRDANAFTKAYSTFGTLAAGDHTIAVLGFNQPLPGVTPDNPAGIIFTMFETTASGGLTSNVIVRSLAANTEVKAYGDVPGFAGAAILRQVIEEAKVRGVLSMGAITYSFTNTTDTDGVTWGDVQDRIVKVATTDYLDLASQLIELSMDLELDPDFVLHAWKRRGTDLSQTVIIRPNRDIMSAAGSIRSGKLRNQGVLRYEGGWVELFSATSKEAYGRREVGLSVGTANTSDQAILTGAAALQETAAPEKTIPLTYTSESGPQPYDDYTIGDTILVPDVYTGMTKARCMSIAAAENDSGDIDWDLAFYPETNTDEIGSLVVATGGSYGDASALYQSEVLSDSPWGYWRLANAAGAQPDLSGMSRSMSATGVPLYQQAGPVDKAMLFSHISNPQYLTTATNTTTYKSGIWTGEVWVNVAILPDSGSGSYSPLLAMSAGIDHVSHDKEILLTPAGKVAFYISQGGVQRYLLSALTLSLNVWYHVVCTVGPDHGMRIYINGAVNSENAAWTTANLTVAMRPFLRGGGNGHNNQTSRVILAEPAIYHRELFASRVASHWAAAGAPA